MNRNGRLAFGLASAVLAAAFAPACGGTPDGEEATSEEDIAEADGLFGDDRVADVLRKDLKKAPSSYQQAEVLFGMGRSCARTDSKEIFVVEEAQTRGNAGTSKTGTILPRAVITGCNTPDRVAPPEVYDPQWGSYSLMMALFSDPSSEAAKKGDTLVFDRVEVMALDRRTGLYNFYVFLPGPDPKGPGIMQRVRLMPDNSVLVYEKKPTSKRVSKAPSTENRQCNDCHVNMGPLMNEMTEPWTNWVSTHKLLPVDANISGDTKSIVGEAASLDKSHARLSFANDLEKIMVAGMAAWNEGLPKQDGTVVTGTGFVQANIDGDQPKRVGGLLKSLFCETELRYASGTETVPVEVFADPYVFGSQLVKPASYSLDVFPMMMPVRSEMDKRIERGLMKKNVVSFATITAIRLFDEKNDIFSGIRCGIYPKVLDKLPAAVDKVDAHLRTVLRGQVEALIPAGPRREYARVLLDDTAKDKVSGARSAYLAEAVPRIKTEMGKVQTPAGRSELKKRSSERKALAEKMFPGTRVPLPLLPPEK